MDCRLTQVCKAPHVLTIAIASLASCPFIVSVTHGEEARTLRGHSGAVTAVAFSRDGRTLASASADKTVKLWDMKTGRPLATLSGHTSGVTSIAFSPDGKTLASGSNDSDVLLWDLATGKVRATFLGHSGKVRCLAFSPDGSWLASGSADRTIRLWDARTGSLGQTGGLKFTLEGHSRGVLCVAFSPDGKHLASGSGDENVKIWSVEHGTEQTAAPLLQRGKRGPVVSVAFSPDRQELALATVDVVEVWELASLRRRLALTTQEKGAIWWSTRYTPQGPLLAIGSGAVYAKALKFNTKKGFSRGSYQAKETEIRLYDAQTGEERGRLYGHLGSVKGLDLSPNGILMASASNDKTVMIWDVAADLKPAIGSPGGRAKNSSSSSVPLWDDYTVRPAKNVAKPDALFFKPSENDELEYAKTAADYAEIFCNDPSRPKFLCPQDGGADDAPPEVWAAECDGGPFLLWANSPSAAGHDSPQHGHTASGGKSSSQGSHDGGSSDGGESFGTGRGGRGYSSWNESHPSSSHEDTGRGAEIDWNRRESGQSPSAINLPFHFGSEHSKFFGFGDDDGEGRRK